MYFPLVLDGGDNSTSLSRVITDPSITDPEEMIEMMYTNLYNIYQVPRWNQEKEASLQILKGENAEVLAYIATIENGVNVEITSGDFYEDYAKEISDQDILKVINFALSQVGRSDSQIEWTNGKLAQNEAWCAHFVSNAFNKYGFLNSKIPYGWTAAASGSMYYWQPQKSKKEKPQPGDIITYEAPKSHVGLVYAVDDMYVYTVEGNCNNLCKTVKRLRTDSTIRGYISTSSYFN